MDKIVFDKEFDFAIKFKWKEEEPIWVDFEGVEVVATYEDGKPVFNNYNKGNSADSSDVTFEEAYEADKLFSGFIKWDGCMEIYDFTHHWCGHDNFAQRIVDMIYTEAHDIMSARCNFDKLKEK